MTESPKTVYIGYRCDYNGCDMFKHVEVVFSDGVEAFCWMDDFIETVYEWREVEEHTIRMCYDEAL